jgi:hypothetical protein
MPSLLSRDLAVAPADKAYVYICDVADTEGLGLTLSDSGKAVLLPRPRGIGDFWGTAQAMPQAAGRQMFP